MSAFQYFSFSSLIFLPLAWLWFRLIDHLRVEWAVNPQYSYGWAVPFLCLYLVWRKAEKLKAEMLKSSEGQAESRKQKAEEDPRDYETTRPRTADCGTTDYGTTDHGTTDYGTTDDKITDHGPRTTDCASRATPHSSPFSFSAFQLFSFFLLCLLYLPTRLIQEANPEWRLVSWALALEVIGLTLLVLRMAQCGLLTTGLRDYETTGLRECRATNHGPQTTDHGPRTTDPELPITHHVSRITHHASRFTFPLCFFLVAVPWPTFIESPLVQGLMRANVGVTIELLNLVGIPAAQHGNVIEIATGMVGIDDACSGIRSFQATLMISLFFGELYALAAGRRALCVFAGFALSFLFNIARTTLLTWVAAHKGTAAIASWHDPAGVTILVACFLSLWALASRLGKVQSPKSKVQSPTSKLDVGCVPQVPGPAVSVPAVSGPVVSSPVVGSPVVSSPVGSSPVVSRPVVSSPVVSLSVVMWSLFAWLLLVEAGTELWYRSHEWRVPQATAWHVEFPRDNATFRELPLSDKTRQFLRYDEGYNGTWLEGADKRWQAIFLRWNPGRIAVHLAKSHTPEACLTAAGRELVSQSGLRSVAVRGLRLPFRSYVVKDESGPFQVFYCLWEDRADVQSFRTTTMTYASRLAPVLAGRRNSGQRSVEVAVWGIADEGEAEAALGRELDKLIKLEKPQRD